MSRYTMTLGLYQEEASKYAVYPGQDDIMGMFYTAFGLASEAGEVAGKIKKIMRGDPDVTIEDVADELGDTLWYVAMLAKEIGYLLPEIADMNLTKLLDRTERDQIRGNGDDR